MTLLHYASLNGNIEIVKILLKQPKIKINTKDKGYIFKIYMEYFFFIYDTLIHLAALEGKFDVFEYLVKTNEFDINDKNDGLF